MPLFVFAALFAGFLTAPAGVNIDPAWSKTSEAGINIAGTVYDFEFYDMGQTTSGGDDLYCIRPGEWELTHVGLPPGPGAVVMGEALLVYSAGDFVSAGLSDPDVIVTIWDEDDDGTPDIWQAVWDTDHGAAAGWAF